METNAPKNTTVISAFPGTGKSYIYKHQKELGITCIDSDSSYFHWTVNTPRTKIKNPNFPTNYIDHIKENLGKYDIIFISSHEDVRREVAKAGIEYTVVYPTESLKNEYIGRYYNRGNSDDFIKTLDHFFDEWIKSCRNDKNAKIHVELTHHTEYLSDVIFRLNSLHSAKLELSSLYGTTCREN